MDVLDSLAHSLELTSSRTMVSNVRATIMECSTIEEQRGLNVGTAAETLALVEPIFESNATTTSAVEIQPPTQLGESVIDENGMTAMIASVCNLANGSVKIKSAIVSDLPVRSTKLVFLGFIQMDAIHAHVLKGV